MQKNYSTYYRELLAAYLVVEHYRHMLEGREFIIFTDHKPPTFAFKQNPDTATPRQSRQLDYLSQFSSGIRHIIGADALSRISKISMPNQTTALCFIQFKTVSNSIIELQTTYLMVGQTYVVSNQFMLHGTECCYVIFNYLHWYQTNQSCVKLHYVVSNYIMSYQTNFFVSNRMLLLP